MTRAPVNTFAIVFDSSSEMIDPPKPMTIENTTSAGTLSPVPASIRSNPSSESVTERTSPTARFVSRKRTMRFMASPDP